MKIMVIVAHIDDAEVLVGGLVIKLTAKGHTVVFVAMSDGGMGHHLLSKEETENRRYAEGLKAAQILGASYEFMHLPECELLPTLEYRRALVVMIRKHAPDIIITHPPADYHADHKYTSELVADALFLLQVPKYAPETPAMRRPPHVFYAVIREANMTGLAPVRVIPIDDVFERRMRALHAHASQMYEWLPWVGGMADSVPVDESERLKFLHAWRGDDYRRIAERYRDCLVREYGEKGKAAQYAEALFASPLGKGLTPDTGRRLFGDL